jgi:hypothetical protein
MKEKLTFLLFALLVLTACNERSEPKSISKDSVPENTTDSVTYNPATPAAQNSDDPSRFSQ